MAYRTDHQELNVITKTYDLILWSCNHTGKFPRNHRFVLGERIELPDAPGERFAVPQGRKLRLRGEGD